MNKLTQVLMCKCGAIFAGCVEPYCYTDRDWLKDLRIHVKEGGKVKMVTRDEFAFGDCDCGEAVKGEDLNQIKLFAENVAP